MLNHLLRSCSVKVAIGKPERGKPLGRSRHRWKDIIKMYIKERRLDCVDWINQALDGDQ
jgi:hypothetical protein